MFGEFMNQLGDYQLSVLRS